MSDAEFKRGMLLLTMEQAGAITNLRFQPRYDLVVNGQKIGTYIADAEYVQNGILTTEDTKPAKFIDDLAKLKISLFEAVYGRVVKIPQQNRNG